MSSSSFALRRAVLIPRRCFEHLGDNVTVHGHVSQAELFRAYRHASVLVFPTLCDGFGLVVQEAFAHRIPVITTTNAGAADLIEDGKNGFLVPPRDAEALADRMRWCIAHPLDISKMRKAVLETAGRWTWDKFRLSLSTELDRVLGCSSTGRP